MERFICWYPAPQLPGKVEDHLAAVVEELAGRHMSAMDEDGDAEADLLIEVRAQVAYVNAADEPLYDSDLFGDPVLPVRELRAMISTVQVTRDPAEVDPPRMSVYPGHGGPIG